MDGRKLALYIMLISATATVLYQTPFIQAIGQGQHTFVNGTNVDCVACHKNDAYQDMNSSQLIVLEAHKRAAGNKNYTTYLQVGGISYDHAAGKINSTNDVWTWNGTVWVNTTGAGALYNLDLNGDGAIEGAETCKLCHSLQLMGVNTPVSEVHTVGIRYCDDDRCHGNRNKQYNDYRLFQDGRINITSAGSILSNNSVHGGFYNEAASSDFNKTTFFHSYGEVPGNAAPNNVSNVSASPYTCLACHSYINMTASIAPSPQFNHSDQNAPKSRYT